MPNASYLGKQRTAQAKIRAKGGRCVLRKNPARTASTPADPLNDTGTAGGFAPAPSVDDVVVSDVGVIVKPHRGNAATEARRFTATRALIVPALDLVSDGALVPAEVDDAWEVGGERWSAATVNPTGPDGETVIVYEIVVGR